MVMVTEQTDKYAGFWPRVKATLIDGLILIPIWLLWIGPFYWTSGSVVTESTQNAIDYAIALLEISFLFLAYEVIMYVEYNGQTFGKRVAGIRVKMEDGSKITYGKSIIRYIASCFSFAVLLLGYISIAWDSKKQGWHDKIAQTVVVKV